MEIVKQYLEQRIEQLELQISDKDELKYGFGCKNETAAIILKEELEQVLTLFNEQYGIVKAKIENNNERMRDVLTSMDKLNSELFPKQC